MKLKYYLRGLGIGIIFAVIIMTISYSFRRESITNEQVIEKAKKLGMVMAEDADKGTLRKDKEETEDELSDDELNDEDELLDEEGDIPVGNISEKENESSEDEAKDEAEEELADVTIEINKGDHSTDLCRKLLEANLIEDAERFNQLLVDFGMDQQLNVGVYEIPALATELDIIAILK